MQIEIVYKAYLKDTCAKTAPFFKWLHYVKEKIRTKDTTFCFFNFNQVRIIISFVANSSMTQHSLWNSVPNSKPFWFPWAFHLANHGFLQGTSPRCKVIFQNTCPWVLWKIKSTFKSKCNDKGSLNNQQQKARIRICPQNNSSKWCKLQRDKEVHCNMHPEIFTFVITGRVIHVNRGERLHQTISYFPKPVGFLSPVLVSIKPQV